MITSFQDYVALTVTTAATVAISGLVAYQIARRRKELRKRVAILGPEDIPYVKMLDAFIDERGIRPVQPV